jgi:ribA/ribD-fused uncharacterized protein
MSGKDEPIERDGHLLFWHGWPSQWHPARFTLDGVAYSCTEQYMMAEKARLFGDDQTLARILAAETPREHKSLGRKVKPFDEARWNAEAREIVYRGNMGKFTQSAALRKLLLATGDLVLVEASPLDTIWGIGLAADDPRATDPSAWRGTNWLGEVLMRVRATIRDAR